MSTDAAPTPIRLSPLEQLRFAREVVQWESRSLAEVAKRLDKGFCDAVELVYQSAGA